MNRRLASLTMTGLLMLGGAACSEPEDVADDPASTVTASATCSDKAGDSKGGDDLTEVALEREGDDLVASFQTTKPIPSTGTALLSVHAWSEDGNTGYQLGAKFDGGQQIAHFVFDQVEASQINLETGVKANGNATTATFPMSEIESLGDSFKWSATYNVNGDDVDTCPEPGKDTLNPKQETFPSE